MRERVAGKYFGVFFVIPDIVSGKIESRFGFQTVLCQQRED